MKTLLKRTTLLDRIVVLALAAGSLGGSVWALTAPAGERLVVEREGRVVFTAPLDADRTVSLEGPLGETVLRVRGGKARVLASPCDNKVCLGMGEIARSGEIVACVPNRLLVRIEGKGKEEGTHDLLSR